MNLADDTVAWLLGRARLSIERGLESRQAPAPDLAGCPPQALEQRASFVTLTTRGELRGCRGMLEPRRPLAADVWYNAWASAFDDPRFAPLTRAEFPGLNVEISVLGPLQRLPVSGEGELKRLLVPQVDGVVLAWRGRRATFLPQVWEDLPDAGEFLAHLKAKAGLAPDFWANDVEIHRYQVAKLRAA